MGHEYGRTSGVLIIAEGNAHVGLFGPILADSYARGIRDLGKGPTAIASQEIILLAVVGYKKIEMSVIVEVFPNDRQSKGIRKVGDSGLLRYIRECAVAVVVVEVIRRTLEPSRPALDIDSTILAGLTGTEGRKIVQMEIHIVRHKQVSPDIAIIVAKGCSRCPSRVITQACLIRNVRKGSIVIVVVKRAACFPTRKGHVHALCVGKVKIRPSIPIIVDDSNASAHRLDNVFLLRTRKMNEFDVRRIGNIYQLRERSIGHRCRWLLAGTICRENQ